METLSQVFETKEMRAKNKLQRAVKALSTVINIKGIINDNELTDEIKYKLICTEVTK